MPRSRSRGRKSLVFTNSGAGLAAQLKGLQLAAAAPKRAARRRSRSRSRSKSRRRQAGTSGWNISNPPTGNTGDCTITKCEPIWVVNMPANKTENVDYKAILGKSVDTDTMPWFRKLASCFERVRFSRFDLEYIPTASAMTTGTIVVGMDWDGPGTSATTFAQVASFSPTMTTSVGQKAELRIPASRLNSRLWYDLENDTAAEPFASVVSAVLMDSSPTKKAVGIVYVHYTAHFMGTRT